MAVKSFSFSAFPHRFYLSVILRLLCFGERCQLVWQFHWKRLPGSFLASSVGSIAEREPPLLKHLWDFSCRGGVVSYDLALCQSRTGSSSVPSGIVCSSAAASELYLPFPSDSILTWDLCLTLPVCGVCPLDATATYYHPNPECVNCISVFLCSLFPPLHRNFCVFVSISEIQSRAQTAPAKIKQSWV